MYPMLSPPRRLKLQPDISTLYTSGGMQIATHFINESAASIVCLCDGQNSVQDIVRQLIVKYSETEEKVSEFVREFLDQSTHLGTISWSTRSVPVNLTVLGSTKYWTPDAVVIELTYNCPLACKHCYLNAGHGISFDRKALHRLCEEAVTLGVDMVQLTGGEPLLYPEIWTSVHCSNYMQSAMCISMNLPESVFSRRALNRWHALSASR